jgi:hypothetical protein
VRGFFKADGDGEDEEFVVVHYDDGQPFPVVREREYTATELVDNFKFGYVPWDGV